MPSKTIHLLWDGKTKFFRLRRPTKKDPEVLPIWNMTSKKDYSPQSLLRTIIQGKKTQHSKTNEHLAVRRIQWTDEKSKNGKSDLDM